MPNRLIKESALVSEDLDKLSNGGERLFWRLILVADDFGRFDACAEVVKARCFPRKVDTLGTSVVLQWMKELTPQLVRYYLVNGRKYGCFVNWLRHQQKRAKSSKFPDPPVGSEESEVPCNQLLANVPVFEIEIENEIGPPVGLAFVAFWKLYPKKTGKKAAKEQWAKHVKDPPTVTAVMSALQKQVEWRAKQPPGKFVPEWKDPERWIKGHRWEDEIEPSSPPPPQAQAPPAIIAVLDWGKELKLANGKVIPVEQYQRRYGVPPVFEGKQLWTSQNG